MNEIKVNVSFEKRTLSIEGVSLVSGDYNSTKLSFIFDKEYEGRKIFELARPNTDEAIFVQEIENNEVILVAYEDGVEKSIFNEVGKYPFEVTLYGNDSKLTSLSGKLRIAKEAVKVGDEVVERYIPIFDQLMQEAITAINEVNEAQKAVEEAETVRKEAEESRVLAETSRAEAEKNRNIAEYTRTENEKTRQASETDRSNAETTRQDNEDKRIENEQERIESEETRIANENTRVNNENIRILNEEAREGKLAVLNDLLKEVNAEGTKMLQITDSADWYGKINVKGVSTQEGTPTSKIPSEIQNVEGNVGVNITAKNKLRLTVGEFTYKGVTIKIEEDGLITLNGTVAGNYPSIKLTNGLEGLLALDYVLTSDWIEEDIGIVGDFTLEKFIIGGSSNGAFPMVSIFNQEAERITFTGKTTTLNSYTSNSSLACLVLYLGDNTITYNNFQFYLMIEEGTKTEVSEYEVYKGEARTFPLSSGQKLMEGSYLADDGIHDLRNQVILDGTEEWIEAGTQYDGLFSCYIIQEDMLRSESINDLYCTHFKQNVFATQEEGITKSASPLNYDFFIFRISTNKVSDLTTWKEFLATEYANGTPVILEYNIKTPKITPYTATQQEAYNQLQSIKTYKNETNITTNSNAIIELTYKKDLQKQLDELQALILETGV